MEISTTLPKKKKRGGVGKMLLNNIAILAQEKTFTDLP